MTRAIYLAPWRIDLDVRDGISPPIAGSRLARAIAAALTEAGAPSPASIGLILTDDTEVAGLNAEHLGKTGPTDVLSFPLLPADAFPAHRGATDRAPGTTGADRARGTTGAVGTLARGFPLPPGRRLNLGDIVVSVERAIEQAEQGRGGQTGDVRWSPADELRLLVTHGALHICGWDHAEPAEEAAMRALEQRLLA